MAKDAKGHGSDGRGIASGKPSYKEAARAAAKFAKQPSTSDRILAAKGSTRRDQHASEENYEAARASGDRYKMAAESIKLGRRADRASDTKALAKIRATTQNKKY